MVWIYWIRDCDGSWLLCSDKEQEERRRGLIITGCCFVFSHDCLLEIHDCQCIDMVNVIQQVFFKGLEREQQWIKDGNATSDISVDQADLVNRFQ